VNTRFSSAEHPCNRSSAIELLGSASTTQSHGEKLRLRRKCPRSRSSRGRRIGALVIANRKLILCTSMRGACESATRRTRALEGRSRRSPGRQTEAMSRRGRRRPPPSRPRHTSRRGSTTAAVPTAAGRTDNWPPLPPAPVPSSARARSRCCPAAFAVATRSRMSSEMSSRGRPAPLWRCASARQAP